MSFERTAMTGKHFAVGQVLFREGDPADSVFRLLSPKVARKDYMIGANLTGGGVDDPDQQLYENYGCGSPRNYTGYCDPELEQPFDRQSMEANPGTRRKLVWEIERKLAEDGARPIIFYNRFTYCWQPP